MDHVGGADIDKNLVFSVTPGRSGTTYLTKLLAGLPSVAAHHEPVPNFVSVMRRAQNDPESAIAFWRNHKLPAIAKFEKPVYAELSHLFCKGFFESALLLGLRPGLIILRRNPSQVAWSLLERNTVPARTQYGSQYLLEPNDPGVLPLVGWERMTDYQLCFWYALEIERRQVKYVDFSVRENLRHFEIEMSELNQFSRFKAMLEALNIPHDASCGEMHARVSAVRHNKNAKSVERPDGLERQEEEVIARIQLYEPLLASEVARRYGRRTVDIGS